MSVAVAQTRERWKMGVEARALVLLTAVLLAFGLAVLYSASAIVALQEGKGSAFNFWHLGAPDFLKFIDE